MRQVVFVSATPSVFEIENSMEMGKTKTDLVPLIKGESESNEQGDFISDDSKLSLANSKAFQYFKKFDPILD
jgi:hypothetical protein